jgi:hypothetical protein
MGGQAAITGLPRIRRIQSVCMPGWTQPIFLLAANAQQKTVLAPYELHLGNLNHFAKPGSTIPGGLGSTGGVRYSRNETQQL